VKTAIRPILTLGLCSVFMGTVWGYSLISNWLAPDPPDYSFERANGAYSIKLLSNFDLPAQSDNVTIILNGESIFLSDSELVAGKPIELDGMAIRLGSNQLFTQLKAPPRSTEQRMSSIAQFLDDEADTSQEQNTSNVFQCVRIQIFRDGQPVTGADITTHVDSRAWVTSELSFPAFKGDQTELSH